MESWRWVAFELSPELHSSCQLLFLLYVAFAQLIYHCLLQCLFFKNYFFSFLLQDHVYGFIKPFRNSEKTPWKVKIEASRALLDLEFYFKGLDAALTLFIRFLEEEPSVRGMALLTVFGFINFMSFFIKVKMQVRWSWPHMWCICVN